MEKFEKETTSQQINDSFCCDEILQTIFIHLKNYRHLARSEQVCKHWRKVANTDSIWRDFVARVWRIKVYIPKYCQQLYEKRMSKKALEFSVLDSKRIEITREEFSSFDFSFRFKYAAGPYWTSLDPFWHGQEALRIQFGVEGAIVGYPQVKWTFSQGLSSSKIDSQTEGSLIRVSLGDITEVTYAVSRHCNWGFIIHVRHAA